MTTSHKPLTSTAGFIGSHVSVRLLEHGDEVVGLDNLNDYYDVSLKEARLARFSDHENFHLVKMDLSDREGMEACLLQRSLTGSSIWQHRQAFAIR